MMRFRSKLAAAPETEEVPRQAYANLLNSPELAAARAMQAVEGGKGLGKYLDTPELINCLREQAAAVNRGDMSQAEAMLMNQASALQSLFTRLIEHAMGNDSLLAFEPVMRMALRAQNQCRATLESLATIKNPQPVAFVKQANIAHNQQVNNAPAEPTRARENEIQPNELLTVQHGETLDTFGTGAAGGIDPAMATVGAINWTENGEG